MTATADKRVLVIAGPNGAGKTTFAREFLPNEARCPVFVNADLIAAGLSPFDAGSVAVQAGRLMARQIREHARLGTSFSFETTLSGRGYGSQIPRWREQGYRVKLFFLRLPSPEAAIARVAQRVAEGGHDVPEPVIRRRFHAGRRNFEHVYRDLVDAWTVYDNSTDVPILGAEGKPTVTETHWPAIDATRDADLAGAGAAMLRAAQRARKRAQETARSHAAKRAAEVLGAERRLADGAEVGPHPAIPPGTTTEKGRSVVESLETLRRAGLDASSAHLGKASACIATGDWAGSIRESMRAVEAVARQVDPQAPQTLTAALKSLERRGALHPALRVAFDKLYGYASDRQGIRHPLLDPAGAPAGRDEAAFMLGACASFARYLWRKHVAGEPR